MPLFCFFSLLCIPKEASELSNRYRKHSSKGCDIQ